MKKKKTESGSRALRVLILEDNAADAELVVRELRRTKIDGEFLLVEDKKGFSEALAGFRPQVILSDFKLPGFDGLDALEMARQQTPDTPFIFVSGSIGEEKAIETLGLGASDYIFKDNLQRLGPAVRRVVADAELRLQKKKTDEELNRHVEEMRLLAEAADRFVHINDLDEAYQYLSRTICGISEAPYLLLSQYDEKIQALRPRIAVGFEPFAKAMRQRLGSDLMQMSFYLQDMRPDVFSDFISRRLLPVRNGLFGFFNEKTSLQDCRAIEKLLAVNAIFNMGFSWENQLFGAVTLFFKKDGELKNTGRVEALVNLAAVAIKRLLTEKSLRESEEKFRLIADNTAETITILDMNLQFTYVSPSIFRLRGHTVEEAQAQTLPQTLTPDSLAQISAVFNEEMALEASGHANPKRSRTLELQEYCKDGSVVWVENSLSFLRDAQGKATGFLAVSKDISERKRVEEEILQQKAFLEKLIEAAPEGIAITDCPGRIMRVNREFSNMFGFSSTEAVGKMIDELVAPPGFAEEANALTSASGSGQKVVLETVRKKKDGSLFNVSIIGAPIFIAEKQVAVYAIYRDITERKRAKAIQNIQYKIANAVITSETFFNLFEVVRNELSALLDTTNFLVALYDEASGMLSAPFEKDEKDAISQWPAEKSLTGLVIKQKRSILLRGEEIQQLDEADSTEQIGSNAEAWLGVPLLINEKVLGAIVVQSYNNADAFDQSSVSLMEMIANQVSVYIERKQTELELHESEAQYRAFFNTSRDCVYITSPAGKWLSMNDVAVELFGYSSREELSQVNIQDLYANPEERAKHVNIVTELGYTKESPVDLRKKDGTVINALITEVSRYDTNGKVTGFQGTIRDITERKRSEELVYASLKEKEVLLQEIHHRVKNNLQIVSGLLTLQADHGLGKNLDEMFNKSQDRIRTIALVHEKLYRSHNLAEIAFDEYLRSLTEDLLISHGAGDRIAVCFETESVLFSIEKAVPLGLIVNELVSNALKHAFPGGRKGEIRIGLRFNRKARFVGVKTESGTLYKASQCELTIADNGIGLPAGFDPAAQKSLGMKLVAMLAMQLQAELKVTPGAGAEFHLLFSNLLVDKNTKDESTQGGI